MTDLTTTPGNVPVKAWALEPVTITATFTGLTLNTLGGTWSGGVYRKPNEAAAYSFTVSRSGQIVTATLSESDATALIGTATKWEGTWRLKNSVDPRTYLAGKMILTRDPSDVAADNGTAVAVTVSSSAVTVAVTSAGTAADIAVDDDFPLVTGDDTVSEAIIRLGGYASDITRVTASRRARRDYARLVKDGTAFHIGVIGDSITTGYNATTTGGYTWVEVMRSRLKQLCGYPAGTHGHRPATTLGYLSPRFTTGAGSPALNGIGLGMNGTFLPYGATVTFAAVDCKRILVNYNRQNTSTMSYLEITDSVDGVITGAGLDGYYSGAGAYPGVSYTVWDSGALTTAASRTFTFGTKTDGSKQSGVTFEQVHFLHEAETAGDIVVWNGGKFGSVSADWLYTFNTDMLGASGVDAGLVVIALGMNETSSTTYATNLSALIDQVQGQYTSHYEPSILICPPWAKTGRATASNAVYVQAVYDIAAAQGAYVLPTHEALGDGANNYMALQDTDGIHPTDAGHRVLGLWMAERVAEFIGAPAAERTISGGTA